MSQTCPIFISYRWRDAPAARRRGGSFIERLEERLGAKWGSKKVFRDTRKIRYGDAIRREVFEYASRADVLFAVIGKNWLELLRNRDPSSDDLLRFEIATALRRGIRVVPLFVGFPSIPELRQKLPADMAELGGRKGILVKNKEDWASTFELVTRIATECIRDGRSTLERVRKVLSSFIPDGNHVAKCDEPYKNPLINFLARKDFLSEVVDFRIWVTFNSVVSLPPPILKNWVEQNATSPVLILWFPRSPGSQSFGFLLLSEWLRNDPGCYARQTPLIDARIIRRQIGDDSTKRLEKALEQEFDAVTGRAPAILRMSRWPSTPVDQVDLLTQLGRLSRIHPTNAVLEYSAEAATTTDQQYHTLKRLRQSLLSKDTEQCQREIEQFAPPVRRWFEALLVPPTGADVRLEVRELRRFFRSVQAILDRDETVLPLLPGYRSKEIGVWRTAVQLFPTAGIQILKSFYSCGPAVWSKHRGQTIAALLLTSPLAIAPDPRTSNAAHDLLKLPREVLDLRTVTTEDDYFVVANFHAADAEAGDKRELNKYCGFAERPECESWELAAMRHYYRGDDSVSAASVIRKIGDPYPRVAKTARHEDWRGDVFVKRGILTRDHSGRFKPTREL
jgi:hypothetical protein